MLHRKVLHRKSQSICGTTLPHVINKSSWIFETKMLLHFNCLNYFTLVSAFSSTTFKFWRQMQTWGKYYIYIYTHLCFSKYFEEHLDCHKWNMDIIFTVIPTIFFWFVISKNCGFFFFPPSSVFPYNCNWTDLFSLFLRLKCLQFHHCLVIMSTIRAQFQLNSLIW